VHSLTPHLICDGAADAIAFYASIFQRDGPGICGIPVG